MTSHQRWRTTPMSDEERQQWDTFHKACIVLWEEIVKALYLREMVEWLNTWLVRHMPFL